MSDEKVKEFIFKRVPEICKEGDTDTTLIGEYSAVGEQVEDGWIIFQVTPFKDDFIYKVSGHVTSKEAIDTIATMMFIGYVDENLEEAFEWDDNKVENVVASYMKNLVGISLNECFDETANPAVEFQVSNTPLSPVEQDLLKALVLLIRKAEVIDAEKGLVRAPEKYKKHWEWVLSKFVKTALKDYNPDETNKTQDEFLSEALQDAVAFMIHSVGIMLDCNSGLGYAFKPWPNEFLKRVLKRKE